MTRARDLAAFVSNADGDIKFDTDTLFIDSSANKVGIRTNTPPHPLSVFGTGAGNATVQIEGESGADPTINFLANDAQHWAIGIDDSDSDTFKISEHSALGTRDYLNVDVSGRVGIGETPNTNWRNDLSNQHVLMLGTEATLFSDAGITTELWNNAYVDNDNLFKNISTRGASRYLQYQGEHKWFLAASASAGTDLTASLNTTPKLELDSDGLKFNGDTAAANALNDYETGTWTPRVEGASSAGTGSYGNQTGSYVKVGNLVCLNFDYTLSSHNGSGSFRIKGLPFNMTSTSGVEGTGSVMIHNFNTPASLGTAVLYLGTGDAALRIYVSNDNTSWQAASIDDNHTLIGSITYRTDS